jgi:MFS family permease
VNDLFGIFLVHSTGMRSPGLYLAAILFGAVAFTAFFKLPKIAEHAYTPTTTESNEHNATNFFKTMRGIPQYIILGLLTFCGIGFPMTIVKIFAQDQFKLSESAFGALAMPGAIAMAVLSVPMAKWGEKFGRARSVHWGLFLCAVGVGVVALGGIAPIFRTPLMMALGGIPVGIGFLLAIPAWYASVSDINPTQRAVNIGAVMTAQGLGAIIGAPLGGAAYRYFQAVNRDFGHYSPFMGCALCLLLAWLVSVRILHDKVTPTSPVLADLVEPLTQTPPE